MIARALYRPLLGRVPGFRLRRWIPWYVIARAPCHPLVGRELGFKLRAVLGGDAQGLCSRRRVRLVAHGRVEVL